jgi:hypothetical protein
MIISGLTELIISRRSGFLLQMDWKFIFIILIGLRTWFPIFFLCLFLSDFNFVSLFGDDVAFRRRVDQEILIVFRSTSLWRIIPGIFVRVRVFWTINIIFSSNIMFYWRLNYLCPNCDFCLLSLNVFSLPLSIHAMDKKCIHLMKIFVYIAVITTSVKKEKQFFQNFKA